MNFRSVIAVTFLFVLAAAAASAQQVPTKIGVVNSEAFYDEKAGITKLSAGVKNLNTIFGPIQSELETMNKRLQTLTVEIENLRKQPNPDLKVGQAKADEAEQLQRNLSRKTEDAKTQYARKESEILGPIRRTIGDGLQEFAKSKGYALIFDISKDQNGLLLVVGDQSVDVTKDFISFFNAKP